MKVEIGEFSDEGTRKVDVRIDRWDTWSMDHTLALIAHPMLKQLRETYHGAPHVELEDVPEELHPVEVALDGDVDVTYFKRWNYVLDEMIFAFECVINEDAWQDPFYSEDGTIIDWDGLSETANRIKNGFILFGKYYQSLWD